MKAFFQALTKRSFSSKEVLKTKNYIHPEDFTNKTKLKKYLELFDEKVYNKLFNISSIYNSQRFYGYIEKEYTHEDMKERLLNYQKEKRILLRKAKEYYNQQLLEEELAEINRDIYEELDRKRNLKSLRGRIEFWKLFFHFLFYRPKPVGLLHAEIEDYDKYKLKEEEEEQLENKEKL